MTMELFNQIKSNKETASFIGNVIGPEICKNHVCPTCPLGLPERLEVKGIKSSCSCAHFLADDVPKEAIELTKVIHSVLGLL